MRDKYFKKLDKIEKELNEIRKELGIERLSFKELYGSWIQFLLMHIPFLIFLLYVTYCK